MSTGKLRQEKREGSDIDHGDSKKTAIDLTEDTKDATETADCVSAVKEMAVLPGSESESSSSSDPDIGGSSNCLCEKGCSWKGRCRKCNGRCCILCLGELQDLCTSCENISEECKECHKIVQQKAMVEHPKCTEDPRCVCCQDCAKIDVETCPSCARFNNRSKGCSEENFVTCPGCTDAIEYVGDRCVFCGFVVCFSCIADEEGAICYPCQDSHRHCKTCGKFEEKKKMKKHPKCTRKRKCRYFCEDCAATDGPNCPGCVLVQLD